MGKGADLAVQYRAMGQNSEWRVGLGSPTGPKEGGTSLAKGQQAELKIIFPALSMNLLLGPDSMEEETAWFEHVWSKSQTDEQAKQTGTRNMRRGWDLEAGRGQE